MWLQKRVVLVFRKYVLMQLDATRYPCALNLKCIGTKKEMCEYGYIYTERGRERENGMANVTVCFRGKAQNITEQQKEKHLDVEFQSNLSIDNFPTDIQQIDLEPRRDYLWKTPKTGIWKPMLTHEGTETGGLGLSSHQILIAPRQFLRASLQSSVQCALFITNFQ